MKKRKSYKSSGFGGEIITRLPKDWAKNLVITKPTMLSKDQVKLKKYLHRASLIAKTADPNTIEIAKMLQLESLIITLEELLTKERIGKIIKELNEK